MKKVPEQFTGRFQENFPLKDVTTVSIGGAAKSFIIVNTPEELLRILSIVHHDKTPYILIGSGSNLLISDEGVDKLVIQNKVSAIKQNGNSLVVESGTLLQDVVDFATSRSLGGLQKITGIPGTVGGAVYGNAGAYGQTISDCILEVVTFDGDRQLTLSKRECGFDYRTSSFKKSGQIIVRVVFDLTPANPKALKEESQAILSQRLVKYPRDLCCPGSFFKNVMAEQLPPEILAKIPPEKINYDKIPAGFLLESVGAKGQKLGNIQISPVHGNLFINLGGGTAGDFYQLAKTYAQKVQEKFGIILEPEVQLINLPALN